MTVSVIFQGRAHSSISVGFHTVKRRPSERCQGDLVDHLPFFSELLLILCLFSPGTASSRQMELLKYHMWSFFFYVLLICVTLFSNSILIFFFFWWHFQSLSVKCLLASLRTSEGNCWVGLGLDSLLQLLLFCSFSRGSCRYPVGFSVNAGRYGLKRKKKKKKKALPTRSNITILTCCPFPKCRFLISFCFLGVNPSNLDKQM